jgi:hypothetical protein
MLQIAERFEMLFGGGFLDKSPVWLGQSVLDRKVQRCITLPLVIWQIAPSLMPRLFRSYSGTMTASLFAIFWIISSPRPRC